MGSSSSKSKIVKGLPVDQRNRYPSQYNSPNGGITSSTNSVPRGNNAPSQQSSIRDWDDFNSMLMRQQQQRQQLAASRGSFNSSVGRSNSTSSQSGLQSAFANPASTRIYPLIPSGGQTRITSAPTLEQLEETEVARAIALSMTNQTSIVSSANALPSNRTNNTAPSLQNRANNTAPSLQTRTNNIAPPSQSRTNNIAPSLQNRANNVALPSQNRTNNVVNAGKSANDSDSKREMAFDCSICMELNEEDVIVATECGHLFHKGCVSPWIQQAGTCPSCRVRVTIASLRKIFVSVNSSGNASTSNTTNSRSNKNDNNKNKNNVNNNSNNNRRIRQNRRAPVTSPTTFNRSIWLSSQDKQMTEQSLTSMISQRFNIPSEKLSIRSLQKRGAPQPPRYVSFKIGVDTESTFNALLVSTKWPVTFRVREFIQNN